MAENVDEVTPFPPSPSGAISGVTAANASSVEPAPTSVNPTMAALFNIVRARSSAPVAPPPGPVSTPSGYVRFTGIVSRPIRVARNDLEGVVGVTTESSHRLSISALKRADLAEYARIGFSLYDVRGSQRSEGVRISQVAESVGSCANVHSGRYLDLEEG